ncbi:FHA domain-containing protein [Roseovarius phycicola]|uniref:FHA domain-containing protein n=1 Tax=Roseovarius phycicola TaxID=3080976 RepID=A0ABZ2HMQ4_9RHOB
MKFLRDIIEEKRAARAGDEAPNAQAAEAPTLDIPSVNDTMDRDVAQPAPNGSADEMEFDLKSLGPTQSYDDDEGWVGDTANEGAAINGDLCGLHDMFADTETDEGEAETSEALNLQGFEVKQEADAEDEADAEEPSLSDALEAAVADLETLQIESETEMDIDASEDTSEDAWAEGDMPETEMSDDALEMAEIEQDAMTEAASDDLSEGATSEDEFSEDDSALDIDETDDPEDVAEIEEVELDASEPELGVDEEDISTVEESEVAPEVEAVTEALKAEDATDEASEDDRAAPEAIDEAQPEIATDAPMAVPLPAAGRGSGGRSGRVKTRILGFTAPSTTSEDPFEKAGVSAKPTEASASFPVGWLVVVDGPGRGTAFTIFDGVTQIGRGEDQTVRLNFGDNSISRENHAAIAYDNEQQTFFIGHGGKANLVRVNNRPVLSTEELQSEDKVRIGETTLRFVAFCGANFSWGHDEDVKHASAQ